MYMKNKGISNQKGDRTVEIEEKEISVEELLEKRDSFQVIDVRTQEEFTGEFGHIKGARLCNLQKTLADEVKSFSPELKYVFVCGGGNRSRVATKMAMENGIKNSYNLVGGMRAWNAKGFPIDRNSQKSK